MDWTNPRVSESAEEEEAEMSCLVLGFDARMRKQEASAQGLAAPSDEVLGGKHPKLADPDEEAEKNPAVINMDSPNRASDAQPDWRVSPKEACAPPKDGIPARGSPGTERVLAKAQLR